MSGLASRTSAIVIACALFLALLPPAAVSSQPIPPGTPQAVIRQPAADGVVSRGEKPPGEIVHAPLTKEPPEGPAVGQTQRDANPPPPGAVPFIEEAGPRTVSALPPSRVADVHGQAPGDFLLKQNSLNAAGLNRASTTMEPSVGNIGDVIFQTGNWFASVSTNNGAFFSYVNPFTTFPTTPAAFGAGFCCDQRVAQDPNRNLLFWYLQYVKTNSTATGTNGVRIAVARSQADLASGAWAYHNFTPADFGFAAGKWFDYPHLQVSSNYLYFTSNVFNATGGGSTDAVVARIPLQNLADNTGYSYDKYVTQSAFSLAPVNGATSRMYFGSVRGTSSVFVLDWPESSTTPTSRIISGLTATNGGRGTMNCVAPGGLDPCSRSDARAQTGWVSPGELGFMWNSGQGTGRPYPFVRTLILNPTTFAVISQPDIYGTDFAYMYPSVAVNSRGHLGGSLTIMGGQVNPQTVALIRDDISGDPLVNGWEIPTIASGTNSPGGFGDYSGTAVHEQYPTTWLGTGWVLIGGTGSSAVFPYQFWFMRARDDPGTPGSGCVANPITIGQTVVGILGATDCSSLQRGSQTKADEYTFTGTTGQAVVISLSSTAFDTIVYLRGPTGAVVASDDDGGPGNNSRIPAETGFFTLPASGIYTIEATAFQPGSLGTYSLSLAAGSCVPVPIALGQTLNVSLATTDCRSQTRGANFYTDQFTFTGATSQVVTIAVNSPVFDTFLYLRGPNGTVVASDDDSGAGSNSLIENFILPTAGTYTIEPTSYAANLTGAYSVTLSAGQTTGPGPNCNPSPLTVGQSTTGQLVATDCRFGVRGDRWFTNRISFAGTSGQQVALSLTSTAFDAYLYLLSPTAAVLATDDDGGGGSNSRIPATSGFFTLPSTGTYIAEITSYYAGATGNYSFSINAGSGAGCTPAPITLGQTLNGSLATSDCRSPARGNAYYADQYSFTGTTGQIVSVALNSSAFDPYVYLRGPAGTVIAQDDDGGEGQNSLLAGFALPSSGNYVIETTSYQTGATGAYSVALTAGAACIVTPLTIGPTVNGSLAATDCRSPARGNTYYADQYSFAGTSGQQVALSLTSSVFDTYLYLRGPAGTVIAQDDDGGAGQNSRIPETTGLFTLPTTGTYIAEVSSFNALSTGAYALTVSLTNIPDEMPGSNAGPPQKRVDATPTPKPETPTITPSPKPETPTVTKTPLPTSTPEKEPPPPGGEGPTATPTLPLSTPSATRTPTVPVNSPTRTPTPTQSTVSGHGFTLEAAANPILTWRPGTLTKSLVIRWAAISNVFTFPGILNPGIASFIDNSVVNEATCYVLMPFLGDLGAPDVRGISDLFCMYPNTAIGIAAQRPTQFRIALNESPNVTLGWVGPGGQTRYVLEAIRFDGTPIRNLDIGGGDVSFTEDIGTLTTCYRLIAFNGATAMGGTDQVCAAPGVQSFTANLPDVATALEQIKLATPPTEQP